MQWGIFLRRGLVRGPCQRALVSRPAQKPRAARMALIGDGGWKNGANKFMRAPLDPNESSAHAGTQAYRHRGETNVVYADGHGDAVRARFRKPAARSLNERLMAWPHNGFLSEDDQAYSLTK